ncbi:MAG: hypothetical protein AUI14_01015 [Actinobacteria bacterium 13_2_20CM_2_71_6]|nr:MAG: hypothetical protein AUI14_01015 [Actinobacteria bacterium 13_2_20CM_2_71_6]
MSRLGHVPEHEAPRSGAGWLGRATALLAGVFAIGTAFIAVYVGALHQPQPRGVPIGVVNADIGPQALLAAIGAQHSALATKVYDTPADADRALADRAVYAVLDTDPVADGLRLTVAGGAAPGVAELITQTVSTMATDAHIPLSVRDTHPAAARDPRGLTPFYLVVGWLLGGYLAATALAVIVGTVPRGTARLAMRLGAFAAFAVLLGLAGAMLMGPGYGIWAHHFGALWLAGTLIVFASAAITAALESWVGLVGTGLAMLLLFIFGNPGSGGVYPPEFLPGPFRDLHRWLPTGLATDLVRAIEYFGAHATGWPIAGLVLWSVAGLAAVLGATLALGHHREAVAPVTG